MGENGTQNLKEYVQIRYIRPSVCRFERGQGGFLKLDLDSGERYERVNLHRAFPLSDRDSYISVRDTESKEIGVIESLVEFDEATQRLIAEDLDRRYFTPVIRSVRSIEEEFGYSYWEVMTDAGPRRFTVRRGRGSLIQIGDNRVLVIDVDGNRFEIEDYTRLGARHSRVVESLL